MENDTVPFRALIFIVAYNAERHIESVLDRIPEAVWQGTPYVCDILVIDDSSTDKTFDVCNSYGERTGRSITTLRTPANQGYGGNQKLGYTYALDKGYDAVVLLHGDGQYAPEMLLDMIKPLADGQSDVVFGSRMLRRNDALKGGMPYYKFVANICLTTLQNRLLGKRLSEFHTGYRAYSTAALRRVPFRYNSDWFDFDTDIIIQMVDKDARIAEIAIPTHYGDEICHVHNVRYGLAILKACLQSRLQKVGIFYHRKFDYEHVASFSDKSAFTSSHTFAVENTAVKETTLVIGTGSAHVAHHLHNKGCVVHGAGLVPPKNTTDFSTFITTNLNNGLAEIPALPYQSILLLDILEHLHNPEQFMEELFDRVKGTNTRIILTTPNIAFIIMRLMLLFGRFEYGKRGILDKTHTRLFTFPSLKRLCEQSHFVIEHVEGIPAPFPLALKNEGLGRFMLKINRLLIRLNKGMFSFQIGVVLTPKQDFENLLARTLDSQKNNKN
jgi:glycosyltransferase involved in cell wall biosynthesis